MRTWWSKLRGLRRRDRLDMDLRAEMDAHLEMEIEDQIERGVAPLDARDRVRRRFGNRTLMEESSREAWMFRGVEALLHDVRYGVRLLRRAPGFALTAVSVIALGIGASTGAFTLLDYVLLRPLPFADPDRLVSLYETQHSIGIPRTQTSPPNFVDWRSMNGSFESMGAYMSILMPVNASGHGDPVRLDSSLVTSDVFRTLAVQAAAGRAFTADDDRVGAPNVVVLSHGVATALFGDAGAAVGQTISLDDQAHTIVGVMPASFAFPSRHTQVWRPLRFSPAMMMFRGNHIVYAVARRKPDVSLAAARADMDVVASRLQRAYPKDNARSGIAVVGIRELLSPQSRLLVLAVFGAAFCLLLIACTNLANLLLARALVREKEIAVRLAIGAGRLRLLRQLLTESLIIAVLGGALGLALAAVGTPLLARLVPAGLPVGATPDVDWRIFTFAAGLILITSLAFGIGPALQSRRTSGVAALRTRTTGGKRTTRLRSALVLAEVVCTVMLLVGAGLLVKALWRVQAVDPGFRTEGVLTLRTALPSPRYAAASTRRTFYERVLTASRSMPGVVAAAYTSYHPMEGASGRLPVTVPGVADDPLTAPQAVIHFVTADFFQTLAIPMIRGRSFDDRDDATAPLATVICASLAGRLWPAQDPIGRQLTVLGAARTVVGVAGDIAVRGIENASDAQIYFPADQLGGTSMYYAPKDLLIRAAGNPAALAPAIRGIVHDIDPAQAVSDVSLLADIVATQSAPRRDQLSVLGMFTAMAFLLAAVGIHGLLSFTVSVRSQEVGVRVALGAARSQILRMFLNQGLRLGIAGLAIAVPLAYLAARGMRALLFGVEPGDPLVYAAAAGLAIVMTLAGSLRPAIRAATIDPALTVRTE
jgi:predicted permease